MSIPIIGRAEDSGGEAGWMRMDGHSLKVGAVVTYKLKGGFNFVIVAHRFGVEVSGRFPCVAREGAAMLREFIERATLHHEHLASFPEGEKQIVMTEDVVNELIQPSTPTLVATESTTVQ